MEIQQTAFYCKQIIIFTFFITALAHGLEVPQGALAADSSIFVVERVKVDVTADDAVSAQEQAFHQAQIQAFNILANRMVAEGDVPKMTVPDANIIATMIKDFEVSNERISTVRYVGEYTFHFDPKSLGNYFSITGVQYTDTKSKPLLILPVLQKNGKTTIWGLENIWMKSWSGKQFGAALVPVEVPIGDLDDVGDINDDNALRFERKNLDRMLLRYNAREAAIVIAVPDKTLAGLENEQESSGNLRISIYRTDRGSAEYVSEFVLKAESGQSVTQHYQRAVLLSFQALQKNWKKRTAASAAQSRYFYVRMPINNLRELVEAQNVLRTLPGLSKISVISIKPIETRLLLTFRGNENRLREALRSGSSYLLSQPYNKDEEIMRSSSPQIANLRTMYDLYHRSKANRIKRSPSRFYKPPARRQPLPASRPHQSMRGVGYVEQIQPAAGSASEDDNHHVHTF